MFRDVISMTHRGHRASTTSWTPSPFLYPTPLRALHARSSS